VEVDVSRRIDQIQNIFFAVVRLVGQTHRRQLDRDAPFPLEIHLVEHLLLHLTRGQCACIFQDAVCERRLAVIDMGDD
jgi:hypothetical protein